jgi:hypothetical protein
MGGWGIVFKTTDGGISWINKPSITTNWLFSFYFIDSNTGWAVGSGGTILKTINSGEPSRIREISNSSSRIPNHFILKQNYPNPFSVNGGNSITTIHFSIPKTSYVKLKIFDVTGREVETLVDGKLKTGKYEVKWNAGRYSRGIYLYRFNVDNKLIETKKLLYLK